MAHLFKELGTTKLISGSVIVSDPCYELGTWCMGRLDNVAKGVWHGGIIMNNDDEVEDLWDKGRVRELILLHEDFRHLFDGVVAGEETYYADWIPAPFHVGVDSGQAGIFDAEIYRDDEAILHNDLELLNSSWFKPRPQYRQGNFYATMCGLTGGNARVTVAGVFSRGAVSSSGYGDGGYDCLFLQVNDEIVGIAIIFIDDRHSDEEDDEEGEDITAPSDELTTLLAGGDPTDLLYRNTLSNLGINNAPDEHK